MHVRAEPRGDRGGERKRRQHFYTCQDYCISEAKRLFGFTLPREDYRELDSHGHDRHIEAIVATYNNYGSDWSSLCVQVLALAQVVPSSKGGQKGKGKGRQPNVADPAAKPKAAPVAKPTGAAELAAAAKTESRDKRGTPAQAKAESLSDARASASTSSSGGPPVAAPVAEGAAPPAEPKTAPEKPVEGQPPAAVASEQPTLESVAPDAQPTAADVLPKEEPELDDLVVKEEPAEEAQAEAPEEEVAEPAAEEETIKEEAPDFEEGAADAELPNPRQKPRRKRVRLRSMWTRRLLYIAHRLPPSVARSFGEGFLGAPTPPRARGAASRET